MVLLSPDLYEFSWRYELPAVITLVPAGVLGLWAFAVSVKHVKTVGRTGRKLSLGL